MRRYEIGRISARRLIRRRAEPPLLSARRLRSPASLVAGVDARACPTSVSPLPDTRASASVEWRREFREIDSPICRRNPALNPSASRSARFRSFPATLRQAIGRRGTPPTFMRRAFAQMPWPAVAPGLGAALPERLRARVRPYPPGAWKHARNPYPAISTPLWRSAP